MPDLVGQVLQGRYRIDHLIGRGGMAEVYKAYDTRRQYPVAIKVMREDLAEDVEFIHRFRREAQALAALSHANIVRFYSFGRQGRLAFIVMDLVEGSTLRGIILDAEGAPLPLGQVAAFTHQIAAALHYAHGENILHRDVKPGNIMIRPSGQVLVADFGIAKAADAATATTVMPGTPAYMSPEQCLSQLVDPRTDVYALGIVVYELLAGRRPFRGDSSESGSGSTRERIRWEQIYLTPPPLRSFNPSLSAQVEAVVLRALEKDRRDRWPSILAFAQAFEQALRQAGVTVLPRVPVRDSPQTPGPPPPVRPPVSGPQPARSMPKRAAATSSAVAARPSKAERTGPLGIPLSWLLVAAGLVVVVLAGLIALWPRGEIVPDLVDWDLESAIRIVEQTGFQPLFPDTGEIAYADLLVVAQTPGPGERVAWGSDIHLDVETGIAVVTPTDPPATAISSTPGTPTQTLTGTSTPTTGVTPITDTPSPATPPITVSPTAVTPTPTPTPSTTGTFAPTPTASSTPTPSPSPAPKPAIAAQIAFMSDRSGNDEIFAMNADGSEQKNLTGNPAADFGPAWSPNRNRIAFGSERDGNWEIYVMNSDGSGQTRLTNSGGYDHTPTWSPDGKRLAFTSERNGNFDIYVINAGGGGLTPITSDEAFDFLPAWAPAGQRIAFQSNRSGNDDIFVINADGSGISNVTNHPSADWGPAWSPNGKRIAFASERQDDWEIYAINVNGSGLTRLTHSPGTDQSPSWSPDGKKIAFVSDRDGKNDIYVMNSDGSGQTSLTTAAGRDEAPSW